MTNIDVKVFRKDYEQGDKFIQLNVSIGVTAIAVRRFIESKIAHSFGAGVCCDVIMNSATYFDSHLKRFTKFSEKREMVGQFHEKDILGELQTLGIGEISSVGWLKNHNKSISLSICTKGGSGHPIFVTISPEELNEAGGIVGLNANKQLIIDFYNKYGTGRPE